MVRKKIKLIIFIFIFLFTKSPFFIFSHPHIFIENSFTFVFNQTELEGIRIKWIFDDIFSAQIILDFDINKNNIFDENEIKAVEQGAFSNLINYNYYLHITINNLELDIKDVYNFNAKIIDNKMVYSFFSPLHIKATQTEQLIKAGCYDDTYFCHVFNSEDDPVKLENNSLFESSWEITSDEKNVYWVTIIPKVIVLKFRNKND